MEVVIKNLEYYKRLPYTLYLEPQIDSDGSRYWTAEYKELLGCKTDGESEAHAVINLQELFDDYVTIKLEERIEIPEPIQTLPLFISDPVFFNHHTELTEKTGLRSKPEVFYNQLEPIAA